MWADINRGLITARLVLFSVKSLTPEDIEITVASKGISYAVQVYPEGPVGFEEKGDEHNKVVISHRTWPVIYGHAETGERDETLSRSEAGIPTSITANGDGGVRVTQGNGDDTISLSAKAVDAVDEHINLTRFKLQSRGFDTEEGQR